LFPNQFVNAQLLLDTIENALVIPSSAVQRGSQGLFVYALKPDGQTVTIKPVKLGASDGDRIAVLEGLALGDRVVTDGTDRLREGARVDIADRATTNNTTGGRPRRAPSP
ncbi:MAG TPA: multidrug transporter subunit MdtA, partial [Burkholderiaceae bacterium]|nr:multidrug transporter subunit MdtA [Burkholderiaceae bacterium]